MTDNADGKKKITVEQQNNGDHVAYINQNNQEFEIEYGADRQAQMGGAYYTQAKTQNLNPASQGGPENFL